MSFKSLKKVLRFIPEYTPGQSVEFVDGPHKGKKGQIAREFDDYLHVHVNGQKIMADHNQIKADMGEGVDSAAPVLDDDRPKRMMVPNIDGVILQDDQKPADYGHVHALLVDKYGQTRGDKSYEFLFDDGRHTGWTVGANIQKEKIKMLNDLGQEVPLDLDDVNYYPLWKEWMITKKGAKVPTPDVKVPPEDGQVKADNQIADYLPPEVANAQENTEDLPTEEEQEEEEITEEGEAAVGNGTAGDLGKVPDKGTRKVVNYDNDGFVKLKKTRLPAPYNKDNK